ncbi:MAG: hypothetical protein HKO02_00075 [Hyphomonadaceae bacterium]|nr:hypothetical protein [Hyphomonadaceae bacterium]
MEKKSEIKVLTVADQKAANADKRVLGSLILVGLLSVLLIVTRGMSGF